MSATADPARAAEYGSGKPPWPRHRISGAKKFAAFIGVRIYDRGDRVKRIDHAPSSAATFRQRDGTRALRRAVDVRSEAPMAAPDDRRASRIQSGVLMRQTRAECFPPEKHRPAAAPGAPGCGTRTPRAGISSIPQCVRHTAC